MALAVGDSEAVDVLRDKYPVGTAVGEYGSLLLGVTGATRGVIKHGADDLVTIAARGSDEIIDLFDDLARQATKNPGSDTVVLGKYIPGSPNSYEQVVQRSGATYFQLDNWDEVAGQVGTENMFKINRRFLDQQLSRGVGRISFTPEGLQHAAANPKSYSALELDYLSRLPAELGYVRRGSEWIRQ